MNPKAAAVYCRISDDRTGQRAGVQRQEEDCRALAESRGWPVADVYVDNDLSAYSGKPRPADSRGPRPRSFQSPRSRSDRVRAGY